MAKMVNFGLAYGMSDFGLASRANIPRKEAQEFINCYFAAYSGHQLLHDGDQGAGQGARATSRRCSGGKRQIPELRRANPALRGAGERMAINMPIQGTAADILKIAMIRRRRAARGGRARAPGSCCRSTTSCCSRCRATRSSRWPPLVRETMEGALPLSTCRSIVDVKVGDDWESMTPLTRADAIAAEADELPLEAPIAPLARRRLAPMPELPEVETVARDLRPLIVGATIVGARCVVGADAARRTRPRRSRDGGRRPADRGASGGAAKQVVVELSGDAALTIHLKMTGQLFVVPRRRARGPVRPARPRARRRPRAAVPRHPQVRAGRAVRARPGDRRAAWPSSAAPRSFAAHRAGAARPTAFTAARFRRRLRAAQGPAQAAAARPGVPRRASATSTPTRRSGRRGSTRCDRAATLRPPTSAAVRGDPADPRRGRRAARLARSTTTPRPRATARCRSTCRSTSAPASRARAAAGRSGGS